MHNNNQTLNTHITHIHTVVLFIQFNPVITILLYFLNALKTIHKNIINHHKPPSCTSVVSVPSYRPKTMINTINTRLNHNTNTAHVVSTFPPSSNELFTSYMTQDRISVLVVSASTGRIPSMTRKESSSRTKKCFRAIARKHLLTLSFI